MSLYDARNMNPGEPIEQGIRSLGQMMLQTPALRAMAAQRQAAAGFQQAHAGYENAAADEARARTGLIGKQAESADLANNAKKSFGEMIAKGLIRTDPDGNLVVDSSLAGPVAGAVFSQAHGANDAGLGLANVLKGMNAPNQAKLGRQNQADIADANNATRVQIADANNTAKAALPANQQVTLSTGQTLASRLTGQPMATGGVTLSPGQERFAPAGGDVAASAQPVATGEALPPHSSAASQTMAQLVKQLTLLQAEGKIQGTNSIADLLSGAQKQIMPTAAPTASANSIPTVNSAEEYAAMPKGTRYKDSFGKTAVKK